MRMKKYLILALVIAAGSFAAWKISEHASDIRADLGLENPSWLEVDSAAAIRARTVADFPLTREELLAEIVKTHPEVTDADIDTFLARRYLEAITLDDGSLRFFRKSMRNLNLLHPDYNGGARRRGDRASAARISYADSIIAYYNGSNPEGRSHRVTYRFSIDVPYAKDLEGDTLRVWMPVPLDSTRCDRQRNVRIIDAEPSQYTLSGHRSPHNSIYFEAPAPAKGDTARFEYVGSFITSGVWKPEADILASLKPYDRNSQLYKRYTTLPDGPHIVPLDSLAHAIVGAETNPYRQSEKVFDYIISRYPWAGAREYSTIDCMPQYVVRERHGDCGQVSLLYISLMRSLGVPARWESGWMLHPGELNLHDWAEVYYEGIGWLPVDVSFGRYTTSDNKDITGFYSHGIDAHRFAANKAVGSEFFPPKRFVRSETVDFQTGEVESKKGNLYYPAWKYRMELIDVTPVRD